MAGACVRRKGRVAGSTDWSISVFMTKSHTPSIAVTRKNSSKEGPMLGHDVHLEFFLGADGEPALTSVFRAVG